MLGTYFYHQILRKTVVSFGTIFNDIRIRHKSSTSQPGGELRVPLAYGPMQKFLARLEQQPELNRAVQITLPRMSFEMTNISYDPTRKSGITQTFKGSDGTNLRKVFMPVPYNIGFELNILVKLNDDALQIIEQILPFFQPSFNLTIDLVDSIGEKRDIPVVLDNISFQDDYEGDFSTRRALIYTLSFTSKTYLFGPVADTTDGLIKKVQVDYYADTNQQTAKREVRYAATPKALQDYNSDNTATLREALTKSKTRFAVNDSSNFAVGNRIIIDNEIMKITEIPDALTLVVDRGADGTNKETHIENIFINVLSASDDSLVDIDDNFGFNETTAFYTDGRVYSPTQRTDV